MTPPERSPDRDAAIVRALELVPEHGWQIAALRAADPELADVSVTLTEVRMSPDLRHGLCFVEPLGGDRAAAVVAALNRSAKYFRGRLGRTVELKFTPDLKFVHDDSFDEAARIDRLFEDPKIRRDLEAASEDEDPDGA